VGGLPLGMKLKLIEPLRDLFKDEVRRIGRDLQMPEEILGRQPFPGPGLAVRILGEVTPERVALLQEADEIVVAEIKAAGLYNSIWQSFAVLLPVMSVGVMGDQRTYAYTAAVRAVHSEDGMTADWTPLPYEVLKRISSRIVNEVRGINRVVYDITSKLPAQSSGSDWLRNANPFNNQQLFSERRLSLALFIVNLIGAILYLYLLALSYCWKIPEESAQGIHSITASLLLAMIALPFYTGFGLLNLIWGTYICFKRRWRNGIFGF